MNIRIIYFFLLALLLTACESQSEKLQKMAKENIQTAMHDIAKDSKSVEISDIEACFSSDSLCIMKCNVKAQNAFGANLTQECEYILLQYKEDLYECAYASGGNDKVFIDTNTFAKNKNNTLYKNLSYQDALYATAAQQVMIRGRKVGEKQQTEPITIPLATKTGLWNIASFKDEFGQDSQNKSLILLSLGQFSNSATTGSPLSVALYVSSADVPIFGFAQYNNTIYKCNDSGYLKVKDSDGNVTTFNVACDYNGSISIQDGQGCTIDFINLLKMGKPLYCFAEFGSYIKTQFQFVLRPEGYQNAKEALLDILYPNAKAALAEEKKYIEELSKKDSSIKITSSGLAYKIVKQGNGQNPTAQSEVLVSYKAMKKDGTVFDSTSQPIWIKLEYTVPGFKEGMTMLPLGSEAVIYVPGDLGYGANGIADKIAPNELMIYEVKLLNVR